MCITWLADSVYTIRAAAAENLKNLTQVCLKLLVCGLELLVYAALSYYCMRP